jgi:acyl-CoA dehydrogenase
MNSSGLSAASPESVYFTQELDLLRRQIERFVKEEIKPNGLAWEKAGFVPRSVLRRMGDLGFLGIRWPQSYGGSGLDTLASVVLAEELGRSTFGGAAITVLVHTDMASPHLLRAGNQEQLERWGRRVVDGSAICAIAVTEPGAGSDVAAIRTTARREGDTYVLNGSKLYITNGVHANLYFVAAKTDPHAQGAHGISLFAVEKGTEGFSVSRALEKHGWLSSDTAEIALSDCRIPAWNLLGQENGGFYAIVQSFQNERIVMGAQAMGEASAAIELTLEWLRTRTTFGAPLWTKQVIRQKLAMLAAKVEAGKQLVRHAAWLDAAHRDCVREVSMVKAFCGELVNDVMQTCLQYHGALGFMRESTIERMARDARVHTIGGGATEIMLEEIAKRMGR